jgi:3-oxoacyl-[acyl-carrier protein] reductase
MNRLNGKVALVTGASRGIGREIALTFAREGALVAVHYGKNETAAQAVVQEIEKHAGKAFALQADVAKLGDIEKLFAKLDAELKARTGDTKFDILVNNAGVAVGAPFEETTEAIFDQNFNVNVKGLFFVTQKALPRIRDNGRIINISSGVVRIAFPGIAAYSATKGAVDVLTLHLAPIAGERNITVNSVSPGATDTDMNAAWLKDPQAQAHIASQQAIHRVGTPVDIAGVALLVASPEAGWITGQAIDATGGFKLA